MDIPFNNYLNRMSLGGTFSDEIILRAVTELFKIEFIIISPLGRVAEATFHCKTAFT